MDKKGNFANIIDFTGLLSKLKMPNDIANKNTA